MSSTSLKRAVPAPHYATKPSPLDGDHAVAFGAPQAGASLSIPIPQLGASSLCEVWPAAEDIRFGFLHVPEDGELESVTERAYQRLIAEAKESGFPHLIRIWNHVPGINDDDHGRERYQRFCEGRYRAFEAAGYGLASDLPAASAVGMRGEGLAIYSIASRTPGVQVENPRQVAAYRYPPRYGPKSPSFSRATRLGDTVFLSGTASVVGHETLHAGDVDKQLEETLQNLDAILNAAIGGSVRDLTAVKTTCATRQTTNASPTASPPHSPPTAPESSCTRISAARTCCSRSKAWRSEG